MPTTRAMEAQFQTLLEKLTASMNANMGEMKSDLTASIAKEVNTKLNNNVNEQMNANMGEMKSELTASMNANMGEMKSELTASANMDEVTKREISEQGRVEK
ncbi:hypothetical protein TNCV_270281 [Trichonephila clavipes]|nr:hypothetical protein TNCV_270281 [Trichonephila clavipes]